MQQVLDLCPKCDANLDLGPVPTEWSSFYPDDKRWARKARLKFKDPTDGEVYFIWKCSDCNHTWDDYVEEEIND
jgi:hypothetical protein